MNRKETAQLLAVIKTAYPDFLINEEVIKLWHNLLSDFNASEAQGNLIKHIQSSVFAPRPANILERRTLTIYEEQQLEIESDTLMLQEYHSDNEVKPMPESIKERLDQIMRKSVIQNES